MKLTKVSVVKTSTYVFETMEEVYKEKFVYLIDEYNNEIYCEPRENGLVDPEWGLVNPSLVERALKEGKIFICEEEIEITEFED